MFQANNCRSKLNKVKMPELPEVETVKRGLVPFLVGRKLIDIKARRSDLRVPLPEDFVARLKGQEVTALRRRAKYLLADLASGESLIIHLGMSGRLVAGVGQDIPLEKHDHIIFTTDVGQRIIFRDPRRFGLMDVAVTSALPFHPLFLHLGPEPLARDFTPPVLLRALQGKQTSIKSALLDQRVVAGLGNIYVCEALFRAGLSPFREAGLLDQDEVLRLIEAIKTVLDDAIAAGGSSLRDYVQSNGEMGYFQHHFAVYGRAGEPCINCGRDSILKVTQSGRSSYYCPDCQT